MKELIIMILVAIFSLITQKSIGQEKGTNEFNVNIGAFTSNDIFNIASDVATTTITGGLIRSNTTKSTPQVGITYRHAVADRWMVFTDVSYQKFKTEYTTADIKSGDITQHFITAGLGTDYRYISNGFIQVYSGASVAYSVILDQDNMQKDKQDMDRSGQWNFQVNALGLRVGGDLAAFLELGVGYKGVVNLGVSYQF
ncbi:hypothetical protein K5X82_08770 [Halosquirtibacter xylanolyticus]|uniref:hypothetical protein n=1 Tax=Halosquirtibacter xylanolyticus TaxID=3374599 RepID=UPI00374890E9|nr:hypothetical protein K5X82_08770 [Prolixibacteraceae bacterium]